MDKLLVGLVASLLSSASFAAVIPFTPQPGSNHVVTGMNGENCHKSAMTIDNMVNLTDNSVVVPPAVSATDCYAVSGPGNDFASDYKANTGTLYEGMFNGESFKNYHVDPNLFLDNANDSWVDATTPGWISLAQINGAEEDVNDNLAPFEVTYSSIGGVDLKQLLNITFGIDNGIGFWSLNFIPDADEVIKEVDKLLGRPTRFDHLAFILKGGNKHDWYMYDFSFWDLMDEQNLSIDLNDPHSISGTWNPNLFFSGKDVSHIQIVAHDPPPNSTDVPEPKALLIFLFSGLVLMMVRRAKAT